MANLGTSFAHDFTMILLLWTFLFSTIVSHSPVWAHPVDAYSKEFHKVKSIETGTAALQLRLDMINRAQKSIDIEYFIFTKSDATRLLVEALLRKKAHRPNVQIRVLIDYFALSNSLDAYYTTALMKKGIEIKYYNPAIVLNVKKVTHRNHRKILLVDKKEAIVGGRNIGDEYFDLKPKFNFMDRDVWVEGPIAKAISESFGYFWNATQSKIPTEPRRPSPDAGGPKNNIGTYHARLMRHKKNLKEAAEFATIFDKNNEEDARLLWMRNEFKKIGTRLLDAEPTYEVNSIRFVGDGTDWKDPSHSVTGPAYYRIIESAKDHIIIETPYFYLQKYEKGAFWSIKERGVSVSLFLNSKNASNEFAINRISLLQGLEFSKMGFDLSLNEGNFMQSNDLVIPSNEKTALWMLHAKTLLTDDEVTWIGTLNMDPRSVQRLNAELALVVEDKEFNAAVKKHSLKRLNAGTKVLNGKVKKTGENPAGHSNPFEFLRSSTTLPFYVFENQI
jgi:putative cardiolipin synthase